MSRTSAAVGGGIGAIAGSIGGFYANRALRITRDVQLAEIVGAATGAIVGAAVFAGGDSAPKKAGTVGELPMPPTPAQADGNPNFVTDHPVQGPTDPGMRAGSCWWAQNVLPQDPACVDCKGPIPMWTHTSLAPGHRTAYSGIGERISFGGAGALGFALSGPEVWTTLGAQQQSWVMNTLVKLNDLIIAQTGKRCAMWGPSVSAAGNCFQYWFNDAKLGLTRPDGSPVVLRTDGVFDQDTLNALITVAGLNQKDFPTPFPGGELPPPPPSLEKKKLSTGAIAGLAAGGLAVAGGIVWAATRKKSKSRRSK